MKCCVTCVVFVHKLSTVRLLIVSDQSSGVCRLLVVLFEFAVIEYEYIILFLTVA